jgi:type IV pilus assembly protein PilB
MTLRERLIDCLIETKRIKKEDLDRYLELQKESPIPLKEFLIQEGLITESELLSLIASSLYIPRIDLSKFKFAPEVLEIIPERIARQYEVIPISKIGDTITVAISDPLNIFALDDLKALTGYSIQMVIAPKEQILDTIEKFYHKIETKVEGSGLTTIKDLILEDQTLKIGELVEESKKPTIIKLIDLIVAEGIKRRASDIHVEPQQDFLRIRYRIDGILYDTFKIPREKQAAILARLKIISGLDITEFRIPQDGRFTVKIRDREIDFRVSCLPVSFGQKFVLRALDKQNLSVGLDGLGFSPLPLAIFKEAVRRPYGMILITGPTGSGKSTTLYSIINQLNTPEKNIITIEDPVEYNIEGITQIQVKPEIGLDFASGLRSLLRQSPDVIMIGEIRDSETAGIAVKASLTGQLVLSTLHTNDACGAITRLIDMGVEPFLVSSSLILTCAQRLCRRLCSECKIPYKPDQDFLKKIGLKSKHIKELKGKEIFKKGEGCKYCSKTGFYGRVPIIEVLLIDDEIKEMILKKISSDEILEYATKSKGMKVLKDDGILKVLKGETSLEEVLSVVG